MHLIPWGHSFDDFTDNQTVRFLESEEWGFIEAVKNMMYGNLFSEFLPKDLYYLEGLLDLPESGITDLQGIEYCQNITELNLERNELENLSGLDQLTNLTSLYLSHNQIDNIDLLSELKSLKTLDISYNNIEDIRVLLTLEELTYLNLLGNPLIKKTPALALLQQRCLVIVD
jgi:Leucine-rich repeat (LRR) protein